MDPWLANLALSWPQDAAAEHGQHPIPSFHCLYPGCGIAFTTPETLNDHVGAHFMDADAVTPLHDMSHGMTPSFDSAHKTPANAFAPQIHPSDNSSSPMNKADTLAHSDSLPAAAIVDSTHELDNAPEPRVPCSDCDQTFRRREDMERHAKKHQQGWEFQCPVARCEYRGSYRKDKLNQHVRNRHPGTAQV